MKKKCQWNKSGYKKKVKKSKCYWREIQNVSMNKIAKMAKNFSGTFDFHGKKRLPRGNRRTFAFLIYTHFHDNIHRKVFTFNIRARSNLRVSQYTEVKKGIRVAKYSSFFKSIRFSCIRGLFSEKYSLAITFEDRE